MEKQQALVIFSGGQDSTTCLIQAIQTYGRENVQAITFQYGQRHAIELERARWIAQDLGVKQTVLDLSLMQQITHNALMDDTASIETASDGLPNTFVDGRNALFLLYAAIYAKGQGIRHIIAGVCETDFSGYPDCRDVFVKSMNVTLNLAMDYAFQIHTPLMYLTKAQTWHWRMKWVCWIIFASIRIPVITAWLAVVMNARAVFCASVVCRNIWKAKRPSELRGASISNIQ